MSVRTVLMIDNNATSSGYLKDLLQYFGFAVTCAPEWNTARKLLEDGRFDVLLFDESQIHRGLGTPLDWLRARGYDQPVLVMTDMALRELWSACLEFGQVELVSKPVSPSTLKFMVESALKKASTPQAVPLIRLSRLGGVATAQ